MNLNQLKKNYKIYINKLRVLNPYLLELKSSRHTDYNKYLIITGFPRSGTTWLAELINRIPKSVLIFEPLHIDKNPSSKNAGFNWRTFISPNDKSSEFYCFFEKLFKLKNISSWNTRFITLRQMVNVDYYIFKFVRANMLIEWLTKNFPLKKPVFIIRHPCAVVSSILNLSWDSNCKLSPEFYNHYPFFNEIINHAKTEEEKFAVLWCQENYVALNQSKPYSFILISYEKLISEPINELKKIFNEWEIEFPPEILSNFSIPSKTFNMNRDNHYIKNNKIDSLKLLGRWKSDLSTKQIDRILKIVNMCGMDFYTDNLEPDYNRLYSDKPIYLPKN